MGTDPISSSLPSGISAECERIRLWPRPHTAPGNHRPYERLPSRISQYLSVEADPLDVYGDPLIARSPDGRSYFIRVLPAGFGVAPLVPGGFGLSALAFALGWVFGRAWRVEVREGEATSRPEVLLSAPLVGIAAKTRGKRAAAVEARRTADQIAQHGWAAGRA